MTHLRRLAFSLLAFTAAALAGAGTLGVPAVALPIPSGLPSGQTPPPLSATATPSPSGRVVQWSGQILDDRAGFVFFTTGDGFRLAPNVTLSDAKTGGPTSLTPVTRVYARAGFDSGNGDVVSLALSKTALPNAAAYADIKKFAVALSPEVPNPDLNSGAAGFSGRPVYVTFTVEVPARTPFSDPVYLATDVSGWSATAIRMDRVDALHYRVAQVYRSGTRFLYRYTRGSWRSSERNQAGQEPRPHELLVQNVDVQPVRDTVYAWGDEDQFAPDLGQSIPTPFNPIPFNTPPH